MTLNYKIHDLSPLSGLVAEASLTGSARSDDGLDAETVGSIADAATPSRTGPETGLAIPATLEDVSLQEAFDYYLSWIVGLPSGSVAVLVKHRRVEVGGEFPTVDARDEALAFLTRLPNVTAIHDTSSVAPRLSAEQLSNDILCTLHTSWQLSRSIIRVVAVRGRVRLIGTVSSQRERWLVESSVWSTPGVLSVESNITIAPAPSDTTVHVERTLASRPSETPKTHFEPSLSTMQPA